jgi:hypothetical protein
VVGFDPGALTKEAPWANETVGLVGTELIRRLNPLLAHLPRRQYDRAVKRVVVRVLARATDPVRIALPEAELEWARTRGAAMVEELRRAGYPVVGDLSELEPEPATGRSPDRASADELLDSAVTALAGLTEAYAELWWQTRAPEEQVEADALARTSSRARALAFRGRRAAARLADRSPLAARAVTAVMRRRRR